MSIKKLILDGEGVTLDFKQTITKCSKIARTMASFANNKGGKLLVGVANDGTILGVKAEEEEKFMLLKAARLYCKPALEPVFEEIYIDNKILLQVEIKTSTEKPHYVLTEDGKWVVYIRIKDKSVLADKIVIDVLEQENNECKAYELTELLSYLEANKRITTTQYSSAFNLSYNHAQCVLVNLMLSGIIHLHANEKEEYFTAC